MVSTSIFQIGRRNLLLKDNCQLMCYHESQTTKYEQLTEYYSASYSKELDEI